jgi:hypothetical protein
MKYKDRTLAVFSVSALDLFASAMGTFILIAIVLFPYYLNTKDAAAEAKRRAAEVEALQRRAAQAKAKAAKAKREAAKAKNEAEKAKRAAQEAKKRGSGTMKAPKSKGDKTLKFAIGCWRTDPFRHSATQQPGVSQYCFDKNGNGNMVFYRLKQREMCGSFATIKRNGALILIDDSDSRCHTGTRDNGGWWADHLTCQPDPSGQVICQGESRNGSRVDRWRVRLHRQ